MSDENTIEVENGEVELASSPGHINVIATSRTDSAEVELRITTDDRGDLAWAIDQDQQVNIETSDGAIAWEPGRGLYVEVWGEEDFYLICSPEQREKLAEAFRNARPA